MSRIIHASYSFWLLTLGPLVFVFSIGPWLDKHFPVISPFVVVQARCDTTDCVVVDGWMEKRRDCRFVEVYARVQSHGELLPRMIEVEFMDRPHKQSVSRPQGQQFWGPWRIHAKQGDVIELHSTHQCHPFWDTKAVIATFEVGQ